MAVGIRNMCSADASIGTVHVEHGAKGFDCSIKHASYLIMNIQQIHTTHVILVLFMIKFMMVEMCRVRIKIYTCNK